MARKNLPTHLRLNIRRGFYHSWFDELNYKQLFYSDLRIQKYIFNFLKKTNLYQCAKRSSRKNFYKSFWTFGNLWFNRSYMNASFNLISHYYPKIKKGSQKKGLQAFYNPFYPVKKWNQPSFKKQVRSYKKTISK